MAKFLTVDPTTGYHKEVSTVSTSAGAGDVGKIPGLDATGRLDTSLMPVGIGAETDVITASEALVAGDFVNIWDSTGAKARKADASVSGKEAHGFVLAAVASGAAATVYRMSQSNTQRTGMTPGQRQYLATTPGGCTPTPPSASGNVVQFLGVAVSATALDFFPGNPTILA